MPRKLLAVCLTLSVLAVLQLSALANPFGRAVIANSAFTIKAGALSIGISELATLEQMSWTDSAQKVEAATTLNVSFWTLTALKTGVMATG